MSGMKSKLGLLAMTAALLSGGYEPGGSSKNSLRPEDIDVSKKEPPIPNGCRRHYFDKNGECPKGKHLVWFDAMKRKSAIIKWERWLNAQGVV
jgi:hypothetical protein